MATVPRHAFVPDPRRAYAYADRPLPIGHGQTISQPYIVAYMTEALVLDGGENVLEIGTGSGYAAAVLADGPIGYWGLNEEAGAGVAINTGTNIPSVATPNGQAAFLFLLTSALAPRIRLSYGRMVIMAFPYTVTMSITGLAALWYLG